MAKMTIKQWTVSTESRLQAVFAASCQELTKQVQTSRAKGGNMPVDTGYLINSGHAAINQIPSGTSQPGQAYDFGPSLLVVNSLKVGDRYVFGWTAKYARFMEAKYAFVRLARMDWKQIVKRTAIKVRGQ